MNNNAIVVGATGVVGKELVSQLCADDTIDTVTCLVRTELNFTHDKLIQHTINFEEVSSWQSLVVGQCLYCALGTTLKQAGNKDAQQKIDLELPIEIASVAKQNGVEHLALVSSTGADANSNSFYLSLKGKLEAELTALSFQSLTIVQPSVLDIKRQAFRLGETIAIKVLNALQFMPVFKLYKPITPAQVAKALIYYQGENKSGVVVKKLDELFI